MFYIYQMVIWLLLLLIISFQTKKKAVKILFCAVGSLLTSLEIASVYLTETFIDYRFYCHLNWDSLWEQAYQFHFQKISFVSILFLIACFLYFASIKMQDHFLSQFKYYVPVAIVLIVLLSLPNGMLGEINTLCQILRAEDKSFRDALKALEIPVDKYVTPAMVTATRGKNIVVISVESLEQGFLGKEFPDLTPQLKNLSRQWTFYNKLPITPGGTWTAGSLYSHQVGVPAFFKGQGNSYFRDTTDVKLTGLGHVLEKAGYDSRYLVGQAGFAGMSELLGAYGISVVSEKNCLGKYSKASCGLNDFDLFEEVKLQINRFKNDPVSPFALFVSTINTHYPDGIMDDRMKAFIPKRENDLEFCVSAIDYLIGDLVNYLREENLLENTAVFIFPDHNLMGSSGSVIRTLKKGVRQGFLITNIDEGILPRKTQNTLYQIDLPRMIIDGAGIKTNAKFLCDFIEKENYLDYLAKNKIKLTTLNVASVKRENMINGMSIPSFRRVYMTSKLKKAKGLTSKLKVDVDTYCKDRRRFIAHAGGMIDGHVYTNCLEAMNLSYSKGFRLFELDIIKTSDNIYVASHDWGHWSQIARYRGKLPPDHNSFLEHKIFGKYTPMDLSAINTWFSEHPDAILVTDKVNTPIDFSSRFVDKKRLMMELFTWNSVVRGIEAGLRAAMPTGHLLDSIKGDKIEYLMDLNVRYIVMSRRNLAKKNIISKITESGIKIFAFHINFDKGKDEKYVVLNERQYFYGLYADKWNFDTISDDSE